MRSRLSAFARPIPEKTSASAAHVPPQQVRLLVTWKPKGKYQRRLHLLILFLRDTGCRITEPLTLRVNDIDFENLLVTLDGKGHKQRIVPFSLELRRALSRYCKDSSRTVCFSPIGSKRSWGVEMCSAT